jgi:hypothetical protein
MNLPPIGVWIAAFLTLSALSFLYKDNPFFRFAESLFAGVSLGYYVGITLNQTLVPNLLEPLQTDFGKNWDLLVPGLLGVMLYMRYLPKIAWVSRYALAIYVTYYIGLDFTRRIHGEALPQVARIIQPVFGGPNPFAIVFVGGSLERAGLLLLLAGAGAGDAEDFEAGNLVPDDLVRRRLRLHGHGPRRPPDRPPQLPDSGLDLPDSRDLISGSSPGLACASRGAEASGAPSDALKFTIGTVVLFPAG